MTVNKTKNSVIISNKLRSDVYFWDDPRVLWDDPVATWGGIFPNPNNRAKNSVVITNKPKS